MLTPKNTTFVVLKKTVVELVDIENEEERRKEDIYELQHRKEVKIVSELCKHPWYSKHFNVTIDIKNHFIGTTMTK